MSKKDYAMLANALRSARGDQNNATRALDYAVWAASTDACNAIVAAIADTLARDNSRFDRARFLLACSI